MKAIKLLILLAGMYLPLLSSAQLNLVDVAENTLKVAGPGEEVFYYGFAEGDKLVFSFEEEKGKELTEIEIMELPSNSRFKDFKTSKTEKVLAVQKTGIYKFRFTNSATSGRVCKFKIQRVPASEATRHFNPSVQWKTVYDSVVERKVQERYLARREYKPVRIAGPEKYFLNGGKALTPGSTSRITIPINLPKNTKEWYYMFSCFKNEADIKRVKSSFNLFEQLTKLIDPSGTNSLDINMLSVPPGGDNCDVHLLDAVNKPFFETKTAFDHYPEGSRENLSSGVIKVKSTPLTNCFIGIKNPEPGFGIYVTFEVVAVVFEEEWSTREVPKYNITPRQVAYLIN